MPRALLTYRCLVISPSDVPEHRDAVERAIHAWNAHTGPMLNARIEPVRWESHARPQIGSGPQAGSAEQADRGGRRLRHRVLLGPARHADGRTRQSGSVEEIEQLLKRGAPVMVYFCTAPVPQDTLKKDPTQFGRLQELRKRYEKRGILWPYATPVTFGSW